MFRLFVYRKFFVADCKVRDLAVEVNYELSIFDIVGLFRFLFHREVFKLLTGSHVCRGVYVQSILNERLLPFDIKTHEKIPIISLSIMKNICKISN